MGIFDFFKKKKKVVKEEKTEESKTPITQKKEKIDGRQIEYYENGNIKFEKDLKTRLDATPNPDEDKTYTEIFYYENGSLKEKRVTTKYDSDGNNGGERVEFKSYYPSGQLSAEKIEDKVLADKEVRYYENGLVKRIYASYTKSLYSSSGLYFEFDEKGNETTERFEKELELDLSLRKHLNLGEFKGNIKVEDIKDKREQLSHEIMTKGSFSFSVKDGKNKKWRRRDSNPRPLDCQSSALAN